MDETDTELLILWILTAAAVLIMLLRICLRKYRSQRLELGDYFTICAIIALLLRGAVIHIALVWGTNSISAAARKTIVFTPEEIYRREVGSKLTIVNRVFYTVYTWLQKCVVMCVLQRLLQGLRSPLIVKMYWTMLGVTFIVAFISTFVDCRPFQLYYQVVPDPGTCSKGNLQLIIFSALNMATDILLIVLPLPSLFAIKRPLAAKIRLILLFLVGLTIVAVTLTRLLMNIVLFNRAGQSHDVANVELFFEAFVANAPSVYGLLHIERRKGLSGGSKMSGRVSEGYLNGSRTGDASARSVSGDLMSQSQTQTSMKGRMARGMLVSNMALARHGGNESDEEMMIELSESSSSMVDLSKPVTETKAYK